MSELEKNWPISNIFNIPSNVCVDVMIRHDQKEQKDAQYVGENGQLDIGDHSWRKKSNEMY